MLIYFRFVAFCSRGPLLLVAQWQLAGSLVELPTVAFDEVARQRGQKLRPCAQVNQSSALSI